MKKGVSASFGGYQASAGLGGGANGGGLYASAGAPEVGAAAGLGSFGGQSSAGAVASTGFDYGRPRPPHQQNGDGFFDRIFAVSFHHFFIYSNVAEYMLLIRIFFQIPINVLHSVNQYVKTKGKELIFKNATRQQMYK